MLVHEIKHPLVQHKLGLMRQVDTGTKQIRELASEIACLLTYEATADLQIQLHTVQGWAGSVQVQRIASSNIIIVPILRAGLGMLGGVLELLPSATVNVLGLYRDEATLRPIVYYKKITQPLHEHVAMLVDPMVATGGTLITAIDLLKTVGCRRIKVLCLVAAPEGLKCIEAHHSDVEIYTAAIDNGLNEAGYILPGLGDAGDKIFGT